MAGTCLQTDGNAHCVERTEPCERSLNWTTKTWRDLSTGNEIRVLRGHTKGVFAVALSKDGTRLASGSADRTCRLWELATGKEIRIFKGHKEEVGAVALSSDNKWLVTGSVDSCARLGTLTPAKKCGRTSKRISLWVCPFPATVDGSLRLKTLASNCGM